MTIKRERVKRETSIPWEKKHDCLKKTNLINFQIKFKGIMGVFQPGNVQKQDNICFHQRR